MEMNVDCMRSVLIYLEQNFTAETDAANRIIFNRISALKLAQELEGEYKKNRYMVFG